MNLSSNFNKYKPIIEYYQNTGHKLLNNFDILTKFYDVIEPLNNQMYYRAETSEFYIMENYQWLIITEEIIYNKLAQLTDEQIESLLVYIEKIVISNKFNNNKIIVSHIQFQKYCNYYHDACKDFDITEFNIDIEFDLETAECISKTINQGKIFQPKTFNLLTQYIKVIGLLGIEV